jgi:hypothetical protein
LPLENTQKRHTTKAEREINLDAYNWVIWKTYLLEKSHPSKIYLNQRGATIGFSSPGAAPLLGKIQTFNRAQLECDKNRSIFLSLEKNRGGQQESIYTFMITIFVPFLLGARTVP